MNAVIAGVLFLLGSLTGITAAFLEGPILGAPDTLAQAAAHPGAMTAGAFLQFAMAMCCAGIGAALVPVIRPRGEGQAAAVAGFRGIEAALQVLGGVCTLSLLALGREFAAAGGAQAAALQSIGAALIAASGWMNNGAVLLCWSVSAWIYYSVFYRHSIVPRWLTGWGLAGISLTTASSVVFMLGVLPANDSLTTAANLPILLQELTFAAWLIFKGYSPAALPAGLPARAAAPAAGD